MSQSRRPLSILFSLSFLACALLGMGCTEDAPPTWRVQYGGGLLDMNISQDWQLVGEDEEARVYEHARIDDLELHISGWKEDFGHDLHVSMLKSMIGKELNLEYGGVLTRVSMTGNAMMKYTREREDQWDDPIHCEEWVLARPAGQGHFARIELSMRMTPEVRANPDVASLLETFDRRVGDAKIPGA